MFMLRNMLNTMVKREEIVKIILMILEVRGKCLNLIFIKKNVFLLFLYDEKKKKKIKMSIDYY